MKVKAYLSRKVKAFVYPEWLVPSWPPVTITHPTVESTSVKLRGEPKKKHISALRTRQYQWVLKKLGLIKDTKPDPRFTIPMWPNDIPYTGSRFGIKPESVAGRVNTVSGGNWLQHELGSGVAATEIYEKYLQDQESQVEEMQGGALKCIPYTGPEQGKSPWFFEPLCAPTNQNAVTELEPPKES